MEKGKRIRHFRKRPLALVVPIQTRLTMIMELVVTQGLCMPDVPELVDDDPGCPVFRVEVLEALGDWDIPPPEFWYVCTEPQLNLYRPDIFLPSPWLSVKDQDQKMVVEFVKNFHVGFMTRVIYGFGANLDQD